MLKWNVPFVLVAAVSLIGGCKRDSPTKQPEPAAPAAKADTDTRADSTEHGHDHPEGDTAHAESAEEADHAHDEEELGTVTVGDMEVKLAQGHGHVAANKEGHLVVKLPYNDQGATVVRAWLGTEDRTLSFVGKGEYAPSHDDYDIHAVAPDPLPDNVMWWIEVEKPDGAKVVGSAKPILD